MVIFRVVVFSLCELFERPEKEKKHTHARCFTFYIRIVGIFTTNFLAVTEEKMDFLPE